MTKSKSFLFFLLISIVLGWFTTTTNYIFGKIDLVEQLPIVLRVINPSWLANDFYLNSTQGFGPRFYYSQLLSTLAGYIPLTTLYFSLTLLANISACLLTILIARKLFGNSDLAGVISAVLFFTVIDKNPIALNDASFFFSQLTPKVLSFPILLIAIFSCLYQKPLYSAVLAGIASLFHPQIGLIIGWCLFATYASTQLIINFKSGKLLKELLKFIPAFLVLIFFSLLYFIPGSRSPSLPDQEFFRIYAIFRVPHHILPSAFNKYSFINFYMTMAALILAWVHWWKMPASNKTVKLTAIVFVASILLLCFLAGYLLVEVFPTRIGASIQAFRFVVFLNWLTIVLLSGWIGDLISNARLAYKVEGIVLVSSAFNPLTLFLSTSINSLKPFFIKFFGKSLSGRLPVSFPLFFQFFLLGIIAVGVMFFKIQVFYFILYSIFIAVFYSLSTRGIYMAMVVFLLCFSVVGIAQKYIGFPAIIKNDLKKIYAPNTTIAANYSVDDMKLWKSVKFMTPGDALFLIPPNLGAFRYLTDRAIVTDFKSTLFQEPQMREWYKRLNECYGPWNDNGFNALEEMEANYQSIRDEKLLSLRDQYDISYALLFLKTSTKLPVILHNKTYKVVSLK